MLDASLPAACCGSCGRPTRWHSKQPELRRTLLHSVLSAPNIWCQTMCCKPCYGMQGLEGFDLRAEEAGNDEVTLEVCRLVLAASPQPGRTMRSTDQCLWDG